MTDIPRSQCCNAPVLAKGRVTRYYVCSKCFKPCRVKFAIRESRK